MGFWPNYIIPNLAFRSRKSYLQVEKDSERELQRCRIVHQWQHEEEKGKEEEGEDLFLHLQEDLLVLLFMVNLDLDLNQLIAKRLGFAFLLFISFHICVCFSVCEALIVEW